MQSNHYAQPLVLGVLLVAISACSQKAESSNPPDDASGVQAVNDEHDSGANASSDSMGDAGSIHMTAELMDAALASSNADASNPSDTTPDGATDAGDGIIGADAAIEPPVVPPQTEDRAGLPLGGLTISLEHGDPDYATLSGRVYAAPRPTFEDWETTSVDGDCELREPVRVECETDCEAPTRCAVGGECAVEPPTSNMGTVRVWGVETQEPQPFLELSKLPSDTYVISGAKLAYPPFSAGDSVIFEASGGPWPGFVTAVSAVEPLELDSDEHLPFEAENELTLNWNAGATDATMNIVVDISFHGGTKGIIACSTRDDGELTIPAEMVTRLIDLGVAGFPHVELERASRGFANVGESHIEFNIVSRRTVELAIPGVVSCTGDEECSEGQVCLASMCQEVDEQ